MEIFTILCMLVDLLVIFSKLQAEILCVFNFEILSYLQSDPVRIFLTG